MQVADQVVDFWVNEVGPKRWYNSTDALDAEIREKFEDVWHEAEAGGLQDWLCAPGDMFGYIILTDQLPRNMFRGTHQAYATDLLSHAAAVRMIDYGWDMRVPEPERQFVYMPLMHSENLSDQDRCVRLMHSHMPETGDDNLLHAKAHRDIIRKFGRFPFRNGPLSRKSRDCEEAYMSEGGYGETVRRIQQA